MKILHVITDLNTGGAEKLMVDLLPALRNFGHSIELCVFNGNRTPFFAKLNEAGIKIHSFGNKRNYYSPLHIKRLLYLAKDFDIIHTHNTAPQLFGAIVSLFSRAIWITTEHTTTSHHRTWWYRPIEKWMFHRYSNVICISEAAKKNMQDIAGLEKPNSIVIPNGINIEAYNSALPIDKLSINTYQHSKVLLMVGRYSYQKDQSTIIRAMKYLSNDIELWLAGYGETQRELESLIKELELDKRVHLLGMRTDIPNLLKASDIAIQSSHIEGFGLAAVEAMAAGIPVIASDVDGLSQVVQGAGLLFEHENHIQLASLISKILSDEKLYTSLIHNGYERAKKYSINQMAEQYMAQYNITNRDSQL